MVSWLGRLPTMWFGVKFSFMLTLIVHLSVMLRQADDLTLNDESKINLNGASGP